MATYGRTGLRHSINNTLQDSTYGTVSTSTTILNSSRTQQWIIDSGASDHVTGEKSWFREYQDIAPVTLYTADKRPLCAVGKGRIDLRLQNGNMYVWCNGAHVRVSTSQS